MKTEVYKIRKDGKSDIWRNNSPCELWFILENYLYDPISSITKKFIDKDSIIRKVLTVSVSDTFSDEGIVRTIVVDISV